MTKKLNFDESPGNLVEIELLIKNYSTYIPHEEYTLLNVNLRVPKEVAKDHTLLLQYFDLKHREIVDSGTYGMNLDIWDPESGRGVFCD